ncbi:MAG TPA: hypothetical protein VN200_06730 [Rhodoglobus sp.]|nr:hypothetical protein [Rhodoglobus sp.]
MTAAPILKRVLLYGGLLAAAIAVIGGVVGFATAGGRGLLSALIGTVMAFVFLGVTAASILLANRSAKSDIFSPAFFGIVLGGWLLKFVVFLALVFVLSDQPWIERTVLFLSIVAGVVGSLVVDVLVVSRSRMPYVSDVRLPGEGETP